MGSDLVTCCVWVGCVMSVVVRVWYGDKETKKLWGGIYLLLLFHSE